MIHIVGLDIRIGTRVRQRCAWCGYLIEDVDLSCLMAPEGTSPWRPWSPGELLEVVEGNPRGRSVVKHESGPLPDGMCVDIDIPKKKPSLRLV
jgi:hypothetical protein